MSQSLVTLLNKFDSDRSLDRLSVLDGQLVFGEFYDI